MKVDSNINAVELNHIEPSERVQDNNTLREGRKLKQQNPCVGDRLVYSKALLSVQCTERDIIIIEATSTNTYM